MKGNKTEKLVWSIFAVIGAVFFVIGIFICILMFNTKGKIETTGVITEITSYRDSDGDRRHNVYVAYEVDGREYESETTGGDYVVWVL